MTSFKGNYDSTLDERGRANFPAPLRRKGESWVLFPNSYLGPGEVDEGRYLVLCPEETHGQLFPQVRNAYTISNSEEKRFSIPPKAKEYLGFGQHQGGDIVFVGVRESIEIWGKTAWEKEMKIIEETAD